jgi:protein-disulfide isomerase
MKKAQVNITALIVIVSAILGGVLLAGLALTSGDRTSKSEQEMIDLAVEVGVPDKDKFIADYNSDEIKDLVEAEKEEILSKLGGGAATPTVVIDGEALNSIPLQDEFTSLVQAKVDANTTEEPVSVEIYEDFNCPHCAEFFPITYMVEAKFTQEEAKFERKNLPFLNQVTSFNYAYAAEAAKKQGKFYEFARALFEQNFDVDFSGLDSLQIENDVILNAGN